MRMTFAMASYDYLGYYQVRGTIEESEGWYSHACFGIYPLVVVTLENDEYFVWTDKVL